MKKFYKYIVALFIVAVSFVGLTGCGGGSVTSISLSASTTSLSVGETLQLQVETNLGGGKGLDQISFLTSDRLVATVDGNGLVKTFDAGEVIITAMSKKDNTIRSSVRLFISSNTASFTVDDTTTTYTGRVANIEDSITYSGDLDYEDLSFSYRAYGSTGDYTRGLPISVGTYTIRTVQVDSKGVEVSSPVYSRLTVNPMDLHLTVVGGEKTYTGAPITDIQISTTEQFNSSEVDIRLYVNDSPLNETVLNAGTYTITAKDDYKNTNYNLVVNNGTLVVHKASLKLVVPDVVRTYGETLNISYDYSLASGYTLLGRDRDVSYKSLISSNIGLVDRSVVLVAGEYELVGAFTAANYDITEVDYGKLIVNKRSLTIAPRSYEAAVNETDEHILANIVDNISGLAQGDRVVDKYTLGEIDEVGARAIELNDNMKVMKNALDVTSSYNITLNTEAKVVYEKIALNISLDIQDRTYSHGLITEGNLNVASILNDMDVSIDSAMYSIDTSVVGDSLHIDVMDGDSSIDGVDINFELRDIGSVSVYRRCFVTAEAAPQREYVVYFNDVDLDEGSAQVLTFNINKISAHIVTGAGDGEDFTSSPTRSYVDNDPTFTYSITGLLDGDEDILTGDSLTRVDGEGVGTYAITFNSTPVLKEGYDYYRLSIINGTLTITKSDITVDINLGTNNTKTYGNADPSFNTLDDLFTLASGELKSGDTLGSILQNVRVVRDSGEDVGKYRVYAVTNTTFANYNVTFNDSVFEITKCPVYIFIDNKAMTYGDQVPAFTYTVYEGNVSGRVLNGSVISNIVLDTNATVINAGGYYITVSSIELASDNYELAEEYSNEAILAVNRRRVVVSAIPQEYSLYLPSTVTLSVSNLASIDTYQSSIDYTSDVAVKNANNENYILNTASEFLKNNATQKFITRLDGSQDVTDNYEIVIAQNSMAFRYVANNTLTVSVGNINVNYGSAIDVGDISVSATYVYNGEQHTATVSNVNYVYTQGESEIATPTNAGVYQINVILDNATIADTYGQDITAGFGIIAKNPGVLTINKIAFPDTITVSLSSIQHSTKISTASLSGGTYDDGYDSTNIENFDETYDATNGYMIYSDSEKTNVIGRLYFEDPDRYYSASESGSTVNLYYVDASNNYLNYNLTTTIVVTQATLTLSNDNVAPTDLAGVEKRDSETYWRITYSGSAKQWSYEDWPYDDKIEDVITLTSTVYYIRKLDGTTAQTDIPPVDIGRYRVALTYTVRDNNYHFDGSDSSVTVKADFIIVQGETIEYSFAEDDTYSYDGLAHTPTYSSTYNLESFPGYYKLVGESYEFNNGYREVVNTEALSESAIYFVSVDGNKILAHYEDSSYYFYYGGIKETLDSANSNYTIYILNNTTDNDTSAVGEYEVRVIGFADNYYAESIKTYEIIKQTLDFCLVQMSLTYDGTDKINNINADFTPDHSQGIDLYKNIYRALPASDIPASFVSLGQEMISDFDSVQTVYYNGVYYSKVSEMVDSGNYLVTMHIVSDSYQGSAYRSYAISKATPSVTLGNTYLPESLILNKTTYDEMTFDSIFLPVVQDIDETFLNANARLVFESYTVDVIVDNSGISFSDSEEFFAALVSKGNIRTITFTFDETDNYKGYTNTISVNVNKLNITLKQNEQRSILYTYIGQPFVGLVDTADTEYTPTTHSGTGVYRWDSNNGFYIIYEVYSDNIYSTLVNVSDPGTYYVVASITVGDNYNVNIDSSLEHGTYTNQTYDYRAIYTFDVVESNITVSASSGVVTYKDDQYIDLYSKLTQEWVEISISPAINGTGLSALSVNDFTPKNVPIDNSIVLRVRIRPEDSSTYTNVDEDYLSSLSAGNYRVQYTIIKNSDMKFGSASTYTTEVTLTINSISVSSDNTDVTVTNGTRTYGETYTRPTITLTDSYTEAQRNYVNAILASSDTDYVLRDSHIELSSMTNAGTYYYLAEISDSVEAQNISFTDAFTYTIEKKPISDAGISISLSYTGEEQTITFSMISSADKTSGLLTSSDIDMTALNNSYKSDTIPAGNKSVEVTGLNNYAGTATVTMYVSMIDADAVTADINLSMRYGLFTEDTDRAIEAYAYYTTGSVDMYLAGRIYVAQDNDYYYYIEIASDNTFNAGLMYESKSGITISAVTLSTVDYINSLDVGSYNIVAYLMPTDEGVSKKALTCPITISQAPYTGSLSASDFVINYNLERQIIGDMVSYASFTLTETFVRSYVLIPPEVEGEGSTYEISTKNLLTMSDNVSGSGRFSSYLTVSEQRTGQSSEDNSIRFSINLVNNEVLSSKTDGEYYDIVISQHNSNLIFSPSDPNYEECTVAYTLRLYKPGMSDLLVDSISSAHSERRSNVTVENLSNGYYYTSSDILLTLDNHAVIDYASDYLTIGTHTVNASLVDSSRHFLPYSATINIAATDSVIAASGETDITLLMSDLKDEDDNDVVVEMPSITTAVDDDPMYRVTKSYYRYDGSSWIEVGVDAWDGEVRTTTGICVDYELKSTTPLGLYKAVLDVDYIGTSGTSNNNTQINRTYFVVLDTADDSIATSTVYYNQILTIDQLITLSDLQAKYPGATMSFVDANESGKLLLASLVLSEMYDTEQDSTEIMGGDDVLIGVQIEFSIDGIEYAYSNYNLRTQVRLDSALGDVTGLSKTYDGTAIADPQVSLYAQSISLDDTLSGLIQLVPLDGQHTYTYTYYDSTGNVLAGAPTQSGSYKLSIAWAGDTDYIGCTEMYDITIMPRVWLIEVDSNFKTYDGEVLAMSGTVNNGDDSISLNGTILTGKTADITYTYRNSAGALLNSAPTDAGRYTVDINISWNNGNDIASITHEYVIARGPVYVDFSDANMVLDYDGTPKGLSGYIVYGIMNNTLEVIDSTGYSVSLGGGSTNSGEYTITITVNTTNYHGVVESKYIIKPLEPTFTWATQNEPIYVGDDISDIVYVTSITAGTLVGDVNNVTYRYFDSQGNLIDAPTAAGDYYVEATYEEQDNIAKHVERKLFTISLKETHFDIIYNSVYYNGSAHSITDFVSVTIKDKDNNTVTGSISYSINTVTNAGVYDVTITYAGDTTYNSYTRAVRINLNKASLSVDVIADSFTIGETFNASDIVSVTGVSGTVTPNIVTQYDGANVSNVLSNVLTSVGSYDLVLTITVNNYNTAIIRTSVRVYPAMSSLDFTGLTTSSTYNASRTISVLKDTVETAIKNNNSAYSSGTWTFKWYGNSSNTWAGVNDTDVADAQLYRVDAQVSSGNNIASGTFYYLVDRVSTEGIITLGNTRAFDYDGNAHTPGYTISQAGSGVVVKYYTQGYTSSTTTAPTMPGSYILCVCTIGSDDYIESYESCVFTIGRAVASDIIFTGDTAYVYGDSINLTASSAYTCTMYYLVGGAWTTTTPTDVGRYEVKAVVNTDTHFGTAFTTLTISPRDISDLLHITNTTQTYSEVTGVEVAWVDNSYAITEVDLSEFTYLYASTNSSIAPTTGSTRVQAAYRQGNYIAYLADTFTVEPKDISDMYTLDNIVVAYGDDPSPAVVFTGADNALDFSSSFVYSYTTITDEPVNDITTAQAGTYRIIASFGNSNYVAILESALTITTAIELTFDNASTVIFVTDLSYVRTNLLRHLTSTPTIDTSYIELTYWQSDTQVEINNLVYENTYTVKANVIAPYTASEVTCDMRLRYDSNTVSTLSGGVVVINGSPTGIIGSDTMISTVSYTGVEQTESLYAYLTVDSLVYGDDILDYLVVKTSNGLSTTIDKENNLVKIGNDVIADISVTENVATTNANSTYGQYTYNYTLNVSNASYETVYLTTSQDINYTVREKRVELLLSNTNSMYDGSSKSVSVELLGGPVGVNTANLSYRYTGETTFGASYNSASAPTEAGTYSVSVSYEDGYYYGSAQSTLTINQLPVYAHINRSSIVYDGTDRYADFSWVVYDVYHNNLSSSNIYTRSSAVDMTNVGSYTLSISISNLNYICMSETSVSVKVLPASAAITIDDVLYHVGDTFEPTVRINNTVTTAATCALYRLVNGAWQQATATLVAGDYKLSVTYSHDNYFASREFEFSVNKATPSVTVNNTEFVYDGGAHSPTVINTTGLTASVTYSGTTNAGTNYSSSSAPTEAGSYTIIVNIEGNQNHYSREMSFDFIISRATPTITFNGQPRYIYDGSQKAIAVTITNGIGYSLRYRGAAQDGTVYNETGTAPTNAGHYTRIVRTIENGNYVAVTATYDFVIDRAIPTLTVDNESFIYNGSQVAISATSSNVDNEDITITYNAAPVNAGEYEYYVTIDTNNYYLYYVGKLLIRPKDYAYVELTSTPASMTYDGNQKMFGARLNGLIDGDSADLGFTYTGTTYAGASYNSAIAPTDAGRYTLNIVCGNSNYVVSQFAFAFDIAKAYYPTSVFTSCPTGSSAIFDNTIKTIGLASGWTAKYYILDSTSRYRNEEVVSFNGESYYGVTAVVEAGKYLVAATHSNYLDKYLTFEIYKNTKDVGIYPEEIDSVPAVYIANAIYICLVDSDSAQWVNYEDGQEYSEVVLPDRSEIYIYVSAEIATNIDLSALAYTLASGELDQESGFYVVKYVINGRNYSRTFYIVCESY